MHGQYGLVVQDIRRVAEDGKEGVIRELRVVFAELLPRPAFGQQGEDKSGVVCMAR